MMAVGVFGETLAACGSTGAPKSSATSGGHAPDPNVTITIVNAGGDETTALTAGYVVPMTKATGVHATFDPPQDFGRLEAMVKTGHPTADIFLVDGVFLDNAIAHDLVEKIDYSIVNPAPSIPGAQNPYGLGMEYFSTIMAWSAKANVGAVPQSWADFFDTKKFPGRRSLCDYPQFTVPAALLADGVEPANLYPLDVERALAVLTRIKDSVTVWWTAGAQSSQLLVDGTTDYGNSWSGRVANAITTGAKLGFTFNQGLIDTAYMVIPKGAAHINEALAFLHQVSLPQNEAAFAEILPYSGPAKGIDKYLPAKVLQFLPTSSKNYPLAVVQDESAYSKQSDEIQKAWLKFKLTV